MLNPESCKTQLDERAIDIYSINDSWAISLSLKYPNDTIDILLCTLHNHSTDMEQLQICGGFCTVQE